MKMDQAQKAQLVYTIRVIDGQIRTPAENGNFTSSLAISSLLPTVKLLIMVGKASD